VKILKCLNITLLTIALLLGGTACETAPKKKTRVITAAEYLTRQEVPIPKAPREKGKSIHISLGAQRAWLFEDGELLLTSPTCTGKPSHRTPTGTFHVVKKHKDWTSTIYHVSMPYFLRLNPWYFGLHAGNIYTQPSSHGCIRLPHNMAKAFFENTPTGTPVKISKNPLPTPKPN